MGLTQLPGPDFEFSSPDFCWSFRLRVFPHFPRSIKHLQHADAFGIFEDFREKCTLIRHILVNSQLDEKPHESDYLSGGLAELGGQQEFLETKCPFMKNHGQKSMVEENGP